MNTTKTPPREHAEALQEFLSEAEEIMDELGRNLAALSDAIGDGDGDCSPDLVNAIFRGAHTLKGLAGVLGFTAISGLAHHLETLLDLLRLGKVPLDTGVADLLFDALDLIGELVRSCCGDGSSRDITPVLERIASCCGTASSSSSGSLLPVLPEKLTGTLTEFEEHRLRENVRKGRNLHLVHASFPLDSFDRNLEELTTALKDRGEIISTLPSPGHDAESIEFDILVGSNDGAEELTTAAQRLGATTTLVHATATPGAAAPAAPGASPVSVDDASLSARSITGTVRVDIAKLDELMAIVGELAVAHVSLAEAVERIRTTSPATASSLVKAANQLGKKLSELQHEVVDIRMIPLRHLYEKLARIVRKLTRDEDRKLKLEFSGSDTKLDKQIIEDISDPLMHLIRNAVDHGIESPAERVAAGKSETGHITVSAIQKGSNVVIEVADDGRGIDLAKVRHRAVDLGFAHSGEEMSDLEALEFIFLPGLSTSDTVSELSGRGVGMDVVRNNIAAISGSTEIETEAGRGSRVIITLPITLAIIRTLIVDVGNETYAVPVNAIFETASVSAHEILTLEGSEVIPIREAILPLVRLDRLFGAAHAERSRGGGYVVVAGMADKRIGIMVDGLRGQQDLVLKPLGELLKGVPGIAGAADLGEDHSILVLDVAGIAGEVHQHGGEHVP